MPVWHVQGHLLLPIYEQGKVYCLLVVYISVRGIAAVPKAKQPGREGEHSLPFGAEVETELNDNSSPHISGGSLKEYMCFLQKK
jgi:hypothetical protein